MIFTPAASEGNNGALLTEGSHRKTQNRRAATRHKENTMERSFCIAKGLFDAIGSIIDNPAFCEWMHKFCEGCPAITRIPATRHTPEDVSCPCDFQPFVHDWCERQDEITEIELTAEALNNLMREAVGIQPPCVFRAVFE